VHFGGGFISVRDDDQGVDLEIGELAVNVDGVQAGDEIDEDIVNTFGDLFEECGGEFFVGGEFLQVDGDEDLHSFGINVADIDTALVCEENPIALSVMGLAAVN
jgi:hypothetical protein